MTPSGRKFKFTDGWLSGFEKRHGISLRKLCTGEWSRRPDHCGGVPLEQGEVITARVCSEDVHNCDETGLILKVLPDRTLCFNDECCTKRKYSEKRIPVMVGANEVGTEKLLLLVIRKAKNPRCSKGLKNLSVGDKEVQLVVIGTTKDSRSFGDLEQLTV